jgi:Ca2+-binding RTX toxin-like protein
LPDAREFLLLWLPFGQHAKKGSHMSVSLSEGATYFLGSAYVEAAPGDFYTATIYAAGGNVINVEGGVAGLSAGIRAIGFSTNYQQNTSIYIGDSGAISAYYSAILLYGGGTTITNEGSLFAGAHTIGSDFTNVSFSYLHNTGSIVVGNLSLNGVNAAIYTNSTAGESVKIINEGRISTQLDSGYAMALDGNSVETVRNTGEIFGDVRLGAGDDTFSSKNGFVDGSVSGGAGADKLQGTIDDDVLNGDAGADILTGLAGADTLSGGSDRDVFVYKSINQSTVDADGRDRIVDFSHADTDVMDLSAIDANINRAGDQALKFIGASDFSGLSGELHFTKAGGNVLVSADVNGDGDADFAIKLTGVSKVVAADFLL